MLVRGSRVGIIGGSVAGCATAIALERLGCDVQVFERSSGVLRDRGSGIAIPPALRDELIDSGHLPADYAHCLATLRWWILADGTPSGRLLWTQLGLAAHNNWGVLWRSLRAGVDDARYHDGVTLHGFSGTEAGAWHYICLDGGHGIVYMIPNFDDRADPGHRRVNWGIYAPQPPGLDFSEPTSIPPGEVTRELYTHLDQLLASAFPPDYEAVIRESPLEEVSIQPIYDDLVGSYSYVHGRVMLIGDAGTVTRPHTGSGATKALQDALCLARLGKEHDAWADLLAAYDAERTAAGVSLVQLGRRLGRDLVEHTPNWGSMTADDFDAWTKQTLSGERLYFYGNAPAADR